MRRRDFIVAIGSATAWAAWPFATRAQPGGMRRIGCLSPLSRSDSVSLTWLNAFKRGLADLGWIEGRNIAFEERWGEYDATRLPALAAQLTALKPDLIFVVTSPALLSIRRATGTIPIVFVGVTDPVGQGYVSSLAQPGGNITGFALQEFPLATKHLDLLKKIASGVARVGVVYDPLQPTAAGYLAQAEAAAPLLHVEVSKLAVGNADEIEASIAALARAPDGGLLIIASPVTRAHQELIISIAARHHLPALYTLRDYVAAGGLASYDTDRLDLCRRAASYADRILKGAKPADLPVQLPTKYSFMLNLKTARALGLEIPPAVLALADEVIE
jgi:putative tryptophan/tyrosine transport system substrate-binding protein